MVFSIRIEGIEAVRAKLGVFSDRRFNAALATAMTRTARAIDAEWSSQLEQRFERPTRQTVRASVVSRAQADRLQADVAIRDQVASSTGRAPVEWLATEERGGGRYIKRFEQALAAQGSLPAGWVTVPGPAAKLDAFGNVSRGQIVQVLAQLGAQLSPGYQRVISASAAKRAAKALATGRQYVAVLPLKSAGTKEGRRPGVYVRTKTAFEPVFLYVRRVSYRPRLSLMQRGKAIAEQQLGQEFLRAVQDSAARLAARGA